MAGYGSTGSKAFLSTDGRTAFVIAYPPEDPSATFGGNAKAEKNLRAALQWRHGGRARPCTSLATTP